MDGNFSIANINDVIIKSFSFTVPLLAAQIGKGFKRYRDINSSRI